MNRNPRNRQGLPFFNPNYFVPENLGQVGDIQRRFFHGPGIDNYNIALLKDTEVAGEKKLQFRAEAFNVFNHAQFNNPGGSNSPGGGNFNNQVQGGFGYVTSARDPRILQLALKFLF